MQPVEKINMENLGYGFKKVIYGFYNFCKGLMKKLWTKIIIQKNLNTYLSYLKMQK